MANPQDYKYDFFNVTFPAEYVAHVEINRPEKMNAFKEVYVYRSSVLYLSAHACSRTCGSAMPVIIHLNHL